MKPFRCPEAARDIGIGNTRALWTCMDCCPIHLPSSLIYGFENKARTILLGSPVAMFSAWLMWSLWDFPQMLGNRGFCSFESLHMNWKLLSVVCIAFHVEKAAGKWDGLGNPCSHLEAVRASVAQIKLMCRAFDTSSDSWWNDFVQISSIWISSYI